MNEDNPTLVCYRKALALRPDYASAHNNLGNLYRRQGKLDQALACYEEALAFASERRSFGGSIAGKQLVQDKLIWILSELTRGQLLCWRLGRLKEQGQVTAAQVSLAERTCVKTALDTARLAREVLGASGITGEYQAMRHLCNLESVFTYEGTHDIHTLIVGHDITGEKAF